MNRGDAVGASRDTVLMLDFLFSITTHPGAPRFYMYHLAQIGMNRGDSWPESCLCNWGLRMATGCVDSIFKAQYAFLMTSLKLTTTSF